MLSSYLLGLIPQSTDGLIINREVILNPENSYRVVALQLIRVIHRFMADNCSHHNLKYS